MSSSQLLTAEAMLGQIRAVVPAVPLEEHAEALTVDEWAPFHKSFKTEGSLLTRCLFMKDKKKQLFLLVTLAETKTDMKVFAKAVGAKEPRFASEDILLEKLAVKKGSVNPFAIINDSEKSVKLCFDAALLKSEKKLCFHPMENSKTVIMSAGELEEFMKKNSVEYQSVDLSASAAVAAAPAAKKEKKPAPKKEKKVNENKKGVSKEGLQVGKEEDFAKWYQQVITKAELIEFYDVSGCYILRPNAFNIWKQIHRYFDDAISDMGVEPCYFPMFVTQEALKKEESHVEGFSAEVAWVTKSGDTEMENPIAIRPTSETVMYPAFAKWIRSYRDLPLRLNQWCNVVRWEFSHATPFIRTREFLWQEGHSAFATEEEASKEVHEILDLYASVYEDLLAVPVVKGRKTEKEKFAGGLYTTTVEAFVPTVGRSVQGATSHCLGDHFSKMFEITYENEKCVKGLNVIQNSWGLTTRTIGVMIMVHGDDKGLVIPPRVAPTQVVLIATGMNKDVSKEKQQEIKDEIAEIAKLLKRGGVRASADLRDNVSNGAKFHHYELRGVPVRLEIGPRELENGEALLCFRHTKEKRTVKLGEKADFYKTVQGCLDEMQKQMLENARAVVQQRTEVLTEWKSFVPTLNQKKVCLIPFCLDGDCETQIKKDSGAEAADESEVDERAPSMGAKSLCIPYDQPKQELGKKCFNPKCTNEAKRYVLVILT